MDEAHSCRPERPSGWEDEAGQFVLVRQAVDEEGRLLECWMLRPSLGTQVQLSCSRVGLNEVQLWVDLDGAHVVACEAR